VPFTNTPTGVPAIRFEVDHLFGGIDPVQREAPADSLALFSLNGVKSQ
jgi:hypothetical protein